MGNNCQALAKNWCNPHCNAIVTTNSMMRQSIASRPNAVLTGYADYLTNVGYRYTCPCITKIVEQYPSGGGVGTQIWTLASSWYTKPSVTCINNVLSAGSTGQNLFRAEDASAENSAQGNCYKLCHIKNCVTIYLDRWFSFHRCDGCDHHCGFVGSHDPGRCFNGSSSKTFEATFVESGAFGCVGASGHIQKGSFT